MSTWDFYFTLLVGPVMMFAGGLVVYLFAMRAGREDPAGGVRL
jgi:hypothetical protein